MQIDSTMPMSKRQLEMISGRPRSAVEHLIKKNLLLPVCYSGTRKKYTLEALRIAEMRSVEEKKNKPRLINPRDERVIFRNEKEKQNHINLLKKRKIS